MLQKVCTHSVLVLQECFPPCPCFRLHPTMLLLRRLLRAQARRALRAHSSAARVLSALQASRQRPARQVSSAGK